MRPEEAIKSMQNLKLVLSITDSERSSVNAAIKALEKQIKAKPVIVTLQNVDYPKCPKCGRVLWPNSENYCATCGQCILWEDK